MSLSQGLDVGKNQEAERRISIQWKQFIRQLWCHTKDNLIVLTPLFFLRNLLCLPMLAHIVMRLLEAISPLSLLVSPIYHPIIYL